MKQFLIDIVFCFALKMNKFACGTCLYINENITSFKSVEDVKNILELCVPEIKSNISKNTIICRQCYYFLKNIENFKHKCIENQRKLLNYNVVAHSSTQEFQLFPQTTINFVPAVEAHHLTSGDKHKSETTIGLRNKVAHEPKIKSKTTFEKSKFPKQSSKEFQDVIELSDSEVEMNDKTKLIYSETSNDEDDIFEEYPDSLIKVKSEPEVEINPSFFNKKSEEGYYHCKLCTKKYKHSQGLYNHTLAEHKELKFYHCNKCNFFTLWKSALCRHESFFHVEGDKLGSGEIEELYLFCYHCSYKTRSKRELEDHIRIHFNYKITTYSCSKCKRNFVKKSLYDFHMESHEKGDISSCDYCDKSYTKKYLKKHLLEIHGVHETYYFCEN